MILRITFIFLFFFYNVSHVKGQIVTDTLGATIVEISVAVDSSNFTGGYSSGPWDLYWGPDQKLWYTNRTALCTYDPVSQGIDTILHIPSGFIMSVATHNDFAANPFVYLVIDTADYYAGGHILELYRYDYSLAGDSLFNPQFILQWYHPGEHSGGRISYGQDDKLYVTTAEYWVALDTLFNNSGKVLRVNPDGTVPADNPRGDYTFTYGHRNPQGIVQVPNGNLFVSEYGQQWDELNLLEANRFYGWIVYDGNMCFFVQDSCNYYDSTVVFGIDVGINPPSGIDYYNHPAIPELNGLVEAITGNIKQGIIVYTMNAAYDSVMQKSYYLTQKYGRVRDVCAAPDGSLYFIARDRFQPDIRVIKNPLFSAVANIPSLAAFSLFPNPASGEVRYRLNAPNAMDIWVTDIRGKNIFKQKLLGQSGKIDVSSLPNGCYFVAAKSEDGSTFSRKLVVIH